MKRDESIDFLRGLGILGMILVHTSYYFLGDHTALFLWNWSELAVPVFIFCSAYVFFLKPKTYSVDYFKKRMIRLLKPYYIFLVFFIPLVFITEKNVVSLKYIVESILTIGGVDISWLVLLFLEFMVLIPGVVQISQLKNRTRWNWFCIGVFGFAAIMLLGKFGFNYRWIMWLPYSILLIFAVWEMKGTKIFNFKFPIFDQFLNTKIKDTHKNLIPAPDETRGHILAEAHGSFFNRSSKITLLAVFLLLFILSAVFLAGEHRSLSFYDNKYPPSLYYLSYGIVGIIVLQWIFRFVPIVIRRVVNFFSLYSYPIFFIHYWVLYVAVHYFLKSFSFTWWSFFLVVLIPTVIIQWGINRVIGGLSLGK